MAAGPLGSPDNPIAIIDSDSDTEDCNESSPRAVASPLAWLSRLSPFKVTKSRLGLRLCQVELIVDVQGCVLISCSEAINFLLV